MKTEVVDNQKIAKNSYIFNIGCMSHPKKLHHRASRKLLFLNVGYENKSCLK